MKRIFSPLVAALCFMLTAKGGACGRGGWTRARRDVIRSRGSLFIYNEENRARARLFRFAVHRDGSVRIYAFVEHYGHLHPDTAQENKNRPRSCLGAAHHYRKRPRRRSDLLWDSVVGALRVS